MIKLILALAFWFCFCSLVVLGQDLPEYGRLQEIKGKTRVYVNAEVTAERKTMIKALDKTGLNLVNKADEAEFFIVYKELSRTQTTSLNLDMITGQIDVFYLRDGKRVIVYSETKIGGIKGSPAAALVKGFLKSLKRSN